ncbi:YheC/YheD family protein [Neobacillus sp. FSL H8-0543]|uniref:YheC/YheD family protein n=1 Tax=Neobacillus sp. FSL H8-0543 TaxID=2954672 RepID=UPI003158E2DC
MGAFVGKWTKHKFLLKENELATNLPETRLLRKSTFHELLDKYGEVILKPSRGFHGKGVILVSTLGSEKYSTHIGNKKIILEGKQKAYDFLRETISRQKKYIVQQKIVLASINNSPFDIRVMVQRKRKSNEWKITGKLAKVAARGYFTTNTAQAVLPVIEALDSSRIKLLNADLVIKEIDQVSLLTANHLMKYYPSQRTFGLDIGIDVYGKVWIIEANLTPGISMFNKLEDKSAYKLMRWFRKG